MKTAVDLITWGVFMVLIHHLTADLDSKKVEHAQFSVPNKVSFKI